MTLAHDLFSRTLAGLTDALRLEEVRATDGGPFLRLQGASSTPTAAAAELGALRVYRGPTIEKAVTISLTVPAIALDSHMLFVFTAAESPVPHFTLDSVQAGDAQAFHLDLLPRLDPAHCIPYVDATLAPLTATFESARATEGLTPARLTPRQRGLMSPWMLAFRATPDAFRAMGPAVDTYAARFLQLLQEGIPAAALEGALPAAMAARDARCRAALFNPDVDPVWTRVDTLLGAATSARMRELLKMQALPTM